MKYKVEFTAAFKKDYKLAVKRGLDINILKYVINTLMTGQTLEKKYKDHSLVNSRIYENVRECHIKPDWLLIYKIDKDVLILKLIRTGTHSDLFN